MHDEFKSIARAAIFRTVIVAAAVLGLAYLGLTFVDGWVMAWIGAGK